MSPTKPKVCFVIPTLNPGGTERQLLYLLEGLRESHECSVICTREAGAWSSAAENAGAKVHDLGTRGGWDFRIRGRVRRVLKKIAPDVVHTFMFGFDLPVVRAARDAGVPVVVSGRRELADWMKERHLQRQQLANTMVDCIIANSKAVAEFAAKQEGIEPSKLRVIYNGIPPAQRDAQSSSIEEGRRVVGMVANFSPVKDHGLFLEIARDLAAARSDVHFLLVGSGKLQSEVEQQIRDHGLASRFTITSSTDTCAPFYSQMDVCVCTSKREGFPNAVLEAMAFGVPVVAAAVGGIPELIEDGESGFLIPARDPKVFAIAITSLLDNADLAKSIARNARRRVEDHFSLKRMVDSHQSLYANLLDSARSSSERSCAASAE